MQYNKQSLKNLKHGDYFFDVYCDYEKSYWLQLLQHNKVLCYKLESYRQFLQEPYLRIESIEEYIEKQTQYSLINFEELSITLQKYVTGYLKFLSQYYQINNIEFKKLELSIIVRSKK